MSLTVIARVAVVIAALGALGAAVACSRSTPAPSAPPPPTPTTTTTTTTPAEAPHALESGQRLPDDPARAVVQLRCVICHDDSYLPQQRLTLEQWQKTIAKMQGFGAPITPEEAPGVAAYLARSFPSDRRDEVPPLVPTPAAGLPR